MIRPYSTGWVKQVCCTQNEWQKVARQLDELSVGAYIPQEAANKCNKILGAPIFNEPGSNEQGRERIVDKQISAQDKLLVNPREVSPQGDGTVIFSIESRAIVRMEMICATIKEGAGGQFGYLGPPGQKNFRPPTIPPYVPDEKCLDASNALGMWFAKARVSPEEEVNAPGPSHMLRAEETVWFRFTRRRFWTPMLCISKQVADSRKLAGNNYLVCEELTGNQQFVLLPALTRNNGDTTIKRLSLGKFLESGDISEAKLKAVRHTLFGSEDDEVELEDLELVAPNVLSGDFVIGGEKALSECIGGVDTSESDLHGVHAQPDMSESENALNLRRTIGQNLAAVIHGIRPKVDGLPSEPLFTEHRWWECPPSRRTVMNSESTMLFLKTTPGVSQIQGWHATLIEEEAAAAQVGAGTDGDASSPFSPAYAGVQDTPYGFPNTPLFPNTPMMGFGGMSPMNAGGWPMPSFGAVPDGNSWNKKGQRQAGAKDRSQSRGKTEYAPAMQQAAPPAALMNEFGMGMHPAMAQMYGFGMSGYMPNMQNMQLPWGVQPPAPPMQRDRSGSPRRGGKGDGKKDGKSGVRRKRSPGPGKNVDPSPALKEFWKDNCAFSSVVEIVDHVAEFARDHRGQNFIMKQIDSTEARAFVVEAILPEVVSLASDEVGFKLIKKLLDMASVEEKKQIAVKLRPSVVRLSNDKHGCWIIQVAVEKTTPAVAAELAEGLRANTIQCIKDLNGNHVIQKVIELLPQSNWGFILEAVEAQVEQLSTHKCACRIILRLIEHAKKDTMGPIFDRLTKHIHRLSKDAYGNYVVQHILDHGRVEDIRRIMRTIQDDILLFAKDSHSSHVVEKCLTVSAKHSAELIQDRQNLMSIVFKPSTLKELKNDKFGPFIIETLKKHCTEQEQRALYQNLDGRHR